MGFKEVASLDADVTVALGKKDPNGKPYPKQAEGYYLGRARAPTTWSSPSPANLLILP